MKNAVKHLFVLMLVSVATLFATASASGQNRDRPSFAELDADKDGKLSLEEFSRIENRRRAPEEMFRSLDKNGDGCVTEDELQSQRRGGGRDQ